MGTDAGADATPAGHPGALRPQEILALARDQLEMDVAFLVEHTGESAVVRAVAGDGSTFGLHRGRAVPLQQTISRLILDGSLPPLVPDTSAHPTLRTMPIVRDVRVGALAGVPVVLPGGEVYGVLICVAHEPDRSMRQRDVRMLRVLAASLASQLANHRAALDDPSIGTERIREAIEGDTLSMVFQPIVRLGDRAVVGYEALARFPDGGPEAWFADAARLDLGLKLETLAIRTALARIDAIPPDAYLAVNVSLDTLIAPQFEDELAGVRPGRLVIELSEHATIEDYGAVLGVARELRERGISLAIDDAGGGFASLSHILQMSPDVIKVDAWVTRGVDADPVRRAVTTSLSLMAAEIDAVVIAEGVETEAEVVQLRALGVGHGQGMFLGEPGALPRP